MISFTIVIKNKIWNLFLEIMNSKRSTFQILLTLRRAVLIMSSSTFKVVQGSVTRVLLKSSNSTPRRSALWSCFRRRLLWVGRVHIDCIAPSITKCAAYLEFKHKQNASQLNLRITSLVHYIGQCGKWSVSKSLSCVKQRAGWKSTIFCHNQALNFAEYRDRTCGMRSCIEQAMSSCPDNQMTYFIDAVNVFSETRIDTDKCITYSTGDHITVTMTSMLTTSLLYLICILFQWSRAGCEILKWHTLL